MENKELKFQIVEEKFGDINLDNGEDGVVINRSNFEKIAQEKNLSKEQVRSVWKKIMNYASAVDQEKRKGNSLGSTDLKTAIHSEIMDFGFSEEETGEFVKRFQMKKED